ncbi:enoyl-CoA hydratase/isomerase family protein [Micromonospora zingiberis]|uniref:Enoyl-CoA hydratase/isomerase family protein n=1 Tax=Micromonospora zingiberis TaxID=2053011 RepID=A0A4R0GJ40_9ACTN|nr:enoyl-CoA hydratase/isomerase family protein [Micromonospora zingiberis]TCB97216.1 enoyl-CoA hydratase/isomerase family protein [Micromonospora zingiberis]
MSSHEHVEFSIDRERYTARITLRRPAAENRVTTAMATQICDFLDVVEQDDDIKVVVLSGEGEHLCAGWEPQDAWRQYLDAPGGSVRKHPSQRARLIAADENWWGPRGLYTRLLRCRKVTVLEARGKCFETGLYFALCCDLVVAGADARFACPRWRNVGVDGDMALLFATVGLKRAKELMFCDVAWSARTALAYGLVDYVADDVAAKVEELANMSASIMRDGIVTEKYAVFASLDKMGIGHSFAATTVVGASLSNIHFQPGEYNFLRDLRDNGVDEALSTSRRGLRDV